MKHNTSVEMNFPSTNISGTIVAANTSQLLTNIAAGATTAPVRGFFIYNPHAANWLWINVGAAAVANGQGSIGIAPLSCFQLPQGYTPEGPIYILGTAAGQAFTAKKW